MISAEQIIHLLFYTLKNISYIKILQGKNEKVVTVIPVSLGEIRRCSEHEMQQETFRHWENFIIPGVGKLWYGLLEEAEIFQSRLNKHLSEKI